MIMRRSFVFAPALWLAARLAPGRAAPERSAAFPGQDPELVRDVVGVAHGNVARLKALVGRQQTLAKATYDWGFGDWESALGAASHIGHREIAEYLIANGAQPTIFSAAMLGQLDVVKAFVTASPGIQRVRGPHGIPLLRHARAGGAAAKPVADYLLELGDADAPPPAALSPAEIAQLAGSYAIDGGANEPVVIAAANGQLTFALAGRSRGLRHAGALAFTPAGADSVRVVFAPSPSEVTLTVHDPDVVLQARKPVKQ